MLTIQFHLMHHSGVIYILRVKLSTLVNKSNSVMHTKLKGKHRGQVCSGLQSDRNKSRCLNGLFSSDEEMDIESQRGAFDL